MTHRLLLLLLTLALIAVGAAPASAATRFALPGGTGAAPCTDVATPCALPETFAAVGSGDTISLGQGDYDLGALALPPVPLHWTETSRNLPAALTSFRTAPTITLRAAQSGSTFSSVEIRNVSPNGPAIKLDPDVAVTIRGSLVRAGGGCVLGADSGEVLIDASFLSSPATTTCVDLGPNGTLQDSAVAHPSGLSPQHPPPVVRTRGRVSGGNIVGGLQLVGAAALAERTAVSGETAIWGEGLVTNVLAQASDGAAIVADAPLGGTLRVVNATALSSGGPALEARSASSSGPVQPNRLEVTNTIARGKSSDLHVPSTLSCGIGRSCRFGQMAVDHTNFVVRDPAVGTSISEGAGNQSGDPRFDDEFHPGLGSPVIDAGVADARAAPTDIQGNPRSQGAATDLGAFEVTPAVAEPAPPSPPAPVLTAAPPVTPPPVAAAAAPAASVTPFVATARPDRSAPLLRALRLSRARFRLASGARVTTASSEAGRLSVTIEQAVRRRCGRVSCTRLVRRGAAFKRRVAAPGRVTFALGRGLRLPAGRYRLTVIAQDAAGNRSAPRRARFTVVR